MHKPPLLTSNFAHLQEHDEQLLRLGMLVERYFPDDPNTTLLKLRQLTELLAQLGATKVGLYQSPEESQYDLLRRLQDQGILPREIAQLFGEVRRAGNAASHAIAGDHRTALATLKITWQLGLWFHRTFKNPSFKSGPFIPPQAPPDESAELRAELSRLRQALEQDRDAHQETAQRLEAAEARLREAQDEQTFWEQMASEAEAAKVVLEQRLAARQAETAAQPREAVTALVAAANTAAAAVHLDEAETRKLIDQQLRQAGWIADSATLGYAQGTRPEKNKNLAIAEWPTHSGPADYVLFVGLTPIAVVEAKRQNVDVSAALQQAKRYSRGFTPSPETMLHAENWGPDGAYRIPFAFASNTRPFLRQLATRSGIWFCDLRRPDNLGHALDGWYTPEGLTALLKRDEERAHAQLQREPFAYGFALRHYQQAAIQAAEAAIARGQRDMLLAMATGTGKTKTSIALIYRLLKVQRFRQAVLAAATSGQLTEEWRAMSDSNSETMSNWKNVTLGDLCESSFYGPRFGKNEYTQSRAGVPTIRTTDMTRDGRINITQDTPKVVVPQDKVEHFRVQKGDLLVTRTGSIGVMAVFEDDYLAIPSAYLIRFRFSPQVLSRYVFYCLMAPSGQERLGLSATAITQPNVNAEAIKRIEIQLPSIDEQYEIVRRVEALFAYADRIEARYTAARAQVERLTPVLLAKAFRGELVPQDPNDEPASVLLERIRASRTAAGEKPSRKVRTERKPLATTLTTR
jgi:Type I restriction modification DNA specificity domain/Type III restriction enzyme, res subunit/Type I restriction enzyme R protein N terminus (HSDR_N)